MEYELAYLEEVSVIAQKLSCRHISEMVDVLLNLKTTKGRLFILGVGGSSSNASHAVGDFRKITGIEAYTPTDNVAELTAWTNDKGWDCVFVEFLKTSKLGPRDCILILSVNGGDVEKNISPNIIKAVDYAVKVGALIMSIVGRSSGYVCKKSDVCMVVPTVFDGRVTPHTESFQSVILHLLANHPDLQKGVVV